MIEGWLDYFYIGCLGLGLILGLLGGFLRTSYRFSALLLAFLSSVVLSLPVTEKLSQYVPYLSGKYIYSFLFLLLVFLTILSWILGRLHKKMEGEKIGLGSRLWSIPVGILLGVLIAMILTWTAMLQPWVDQERIFSQPSWFFSKVAQWLTYLNRYYM